MEAPQSVSFPMRFAVTLRLNTEVIALPEPKKISANKIIV